MRDTSGGAAYRTGRPKDKNVLTRPNLSGVDQSCPSRQVRDANAGSLSKTQVLWQRNHRGIRNGHIFRVTTITRESQVSTRTEDRLAHDLAR